MRIVAFGDIHGDTGVLPRIPELPTADAVLVTGDLTMVGGAVEVKRVLGRITSLAAGAGHRVFAQIGNMDRSEAQLMMDREGLSMHAKGILLSDALGLVGVGYSTPTPFDTPSEASEEQIAAWLGAGWDMLPQDTPFILASHTPPQGTNCDRITSGHHVGSRAVRAFIEDKKPLLCICGHIHEAVGRDLLGETIILNPGPVSGGGYVLIDCDAHGVLHARLMNL